MFDKYTIKEGESLENIASKFNTDIETIKDINNIFNDDSIREDMEIIVPKNME